MAKPDQLIKRRGKLGLIKVNADLAEVKSWIDERMGRDIQVHCMICIARAGLREPLLLDSRVITLILWSLGPTTVYPPPNRKRRFNRFRRFCT